MVCFLVHYRINTENVSDGDIREIPRVLSLGRAFGMGAYFPILENVIWESRIPMFSTRFDFFKNIVFSKRKKAPKIFPPPIGIQHSHGKGMLSLGKKIKILLSLPTITAPNRCSLPPTIVASSHGQGYF